MTSSHFNSFADENHQKVVLSADSQILLTVGSEHKNIIMGKVIHLLVLISILVSVNCFDRGIDEPLFLSELILKGDYSTARNLSVVRHREMDWLTSYAGIILICR